MTAISPQQALAALRAARGPAWIIEPVAGRIAAANEAGTALFAAPSALDSAMPAIVRLRDIVRGIDPLIDTPRPLLFWTRTGTRALACTIDLVSEGGARPVSVLVVASAPETDVKRPQPRAELNVDEPVRPIDDAATLREIARRIREGTAALAGRRIEDPVASADGVRIMEAETAGNDVGTVLADNGGEPERGPATAAASQSPAGSQTGIDKNALAKLAHELKTPLSAIAAAAEIMRDERLGAMSNVRYRDYAADIHSGATHALSVIERLLQPSSKDLHAAEPDIALSFEAVDINKLTAGVVSSLEPLAAKAGITLSSELADDLTLLTCDPTSLRQILINLLTNALKFLRAGDRVTVTTSSDARGAISIEVDDTGPGMSREEISRALDPVAPAPASVRAGGGMGLGLPLVKSLVEANAGRLSIDSRPGRGTRVSITFPRNRLIAI